MNDILKNIQNIIVSFNLEFTDYVRVKGKSVSFKIKRKIKTHSYISFDLKFAW